MESGVPPYIGLPAMIGWASVSTGDRVADGLDVYPLVERPGSRIQAAGPRLSPNVPDMVCSSVSRWTMQLCSRLVRFSDTITRVRPTSRHAPAMNKNSKHAGAGDSEPVAGKKPPRSGRSRTRVGYRCADRPDGQGRSNSDHGHRSDSAAIGSSARCNPMRRIGEQGLIGDPDRECRGLRPWP